MLGAAGGTGLAAIEIGKLLGLRVVACASSDEKLQFCKKHGADILFNYAKEDLKEGLKKIGGAKGIDIVFDPVGGDFTEAALRSLGWEGRLLVIGFASGPIPRIPLNLALLKSCDIRGVFWGGFNKAFPAQRAAPTSSASCSGPRKENSRRTCTRPSRWRRRRKPWPCSQAARRWAR